MDLSARRFIPRTVTGGVEILHFLNTIFTTTLEDWKLSNYTKTINSPQRHITESPLRYFHRLQEAQNFLHDLGHHLSIELIPCIKGLIVKRHKDQFDKVVLQEEVDNINKNGIWPRTWRSALQPVNISKLAFIINKHFKKLPFKLPSSTPTTPTTPSTDTRLTRVENRTPFSHHSAIVRACTTDPQGFCTGWMQTLLQNTSPSICIFHGINHPGNGSASSNCAKLCSLLRDITTNKNGNRRPHNPYDNGNGHRQPRQPNINNGNNNGSHTNNGNGTNTGNHGGNHNSNGTDLSSHFRYNHGTSNGRSDSCGNTNGNTSAGTDQSNGTGTGNGRVQNPYNRNRTIPQGNRADVDPPLGDGVVGTDNVEPNDTSAPSETYSQPCTVIFNNTVNDCIPNTTNPNTSALPPSSLPHDQTAYVTIYSNPLGHIQQQSIPPIQRRDKIIKSLSALVPPETDLIKACLADPVDPALSTSRGDTPHFVIDSEATHHMVFDASLLHEIFPWNPPSDAQRFVHLANGQQVPIEGYCHISIRVEEYPILVPNVLYVPHLTNNLFSVPEHCTFQGCTQLAMDNSMILTYPTFCLKSSLQSNKLPFTPISDY